MKRQRASKLLMEEPHPYLTPEHKDAFRGLPVLEPNSTRTVLCPKCKGHGGWHLSLNAYGPGEHFDAVCSQCDGFGWVEPGPDATCIHEWEEKAIGRCRQRWTCKKGCGVSREIDSSD